ncbi:hypothetical protein O9X98_06510 [Agrobacterium salinitolerans]|nr:hypothetical protein [Agrobacterium salinitolerans]
MVDRIETWKSIVQSLQLIDDAVELIDGIELDESDLAAQLDAIRRAVKEVRGAAHDFIQPDKG